MNRLLYYSTNKDAPDVTLAEALLTGQAPDKGLYMPCSIPVVTAQELESLRAKTYPEIAEFMKRTGMFAPGIYPVSFQSPV